MIQLTSIICQGLTGQILHVEVDIQNGLPSCTIWGLGDIAVQESRDRIRSAIRNSGYDFPLKRITINLAPAHLRKTGSGYDLAIALGIILDGKDLATSSTPLEKTLFLGELWLDGRVRPISGVLAAVLASKRLGFERVIVPQENIQEALRVEGIIVSGVFSLCEIYEHLTLWSLLPLSPPSVLSRETLSFQFPLLEHVRGQARAKRALLISAAGGHNILLEWPPGTGKTLLSSCLPGILPPMTSDEVLEVSEIYSVGGMLSETLPLIQIRPFRKVHHTASGASILWWGRNSRPGEVSLAHRGVLFFDELLEFSRPTLESLREPIEDGQITISRVLARCTYPTKFLFVGATNPCPCGYSGDPKKECRCSTKEISKYRSKLSGPLLDRIDLVIRLQRTETKEMNQESWISKDTSSLYQEKVIRVRERTGARSLGSYTTNSEIPSDILDWIPIESSALTYLRLAIDRLQLSLRSYYRILRVSQTIADLWERSEITQADIAEALSYR